MFCVLSLLKRNEVLLQGKTTTGGIVRFSADSSTASMLLDELQGEGKADKFIVIIKKIVPQLKNESVSYLVS